MSDVAFSYVFVRRDLTVAQQIIQSNHATYEAARMAPEGEPTPHICLFEVANERELISVTNELEKLFVTYSVFYEHDHDMGFSALATAPIRGEARQAFANYTKYS